MNHYLIKLRFSGAVHFGLNDAGSALSGAADHFCADMLFSALCHAALEQQGTAGAERLCAMVQAGELRLSDGMPWQERAWEDVFYLPRPCVSFGNTAAEVPLRYHKTMKKLAWLPVEDWAKFAAAVTAGTVYEAQPLRLGQGVLSNHAAIPYGKDAEPYQVGGYYFAPDCGLYFLLSCARREDHAWVCDLLERLTYSGLGGKRSIGYGQFGVEDCIELEEPVDAQTQWLADALDCTDADRYLLLTTSLPHERELDAALEGANFKLTRRGGFVQSQTYADSPQKKDTQYFLAAGAMLRQRFEGALYQVGREGAHPVYRYGRPILLGVKL